MDKYRFFLFEKADEPGILAEILTNSRWNFDQKSRWLHLFSPSNGRSSGIATRIFLPSFRGVWREEESGFVLVHGKLK